MALKCDFYCANQLRGSTVWNSSPSLTWKLVHICCTFCTTWKLSKSVDLSGRMWYILKPSYQCTSHTPCNDFLFACERDSFGDEAFQLCTFELSKYEITSDFVFWKVHGVFSSCLCCLSGFLVYSAQSNMALLNLFEVIFLHNCVQISVLIIPFSLNEPV